MGKITAFIGVLVVVAGCAGMAAFNRLPEYQKQAWWRCEDLVRPVMCREYAAGSLLQGNCVAHQRDDWAKLQADIDRRNFLVANGCPPAMVEPARY